MLHSLSIMDFGNDSDYATKKINKKKLHELLNKYGSIEALEKTADLRDSYAFDFAKINGNLEEVLEERRLGYREPKSDNNDDLLQSNVKQSNSLLPEDEDFSLDGLTLTDKQRMALKKLDMANQLSIIKKLREEQGVERPKAKPETPQTSQNELDILREKVVNLAY
jgi:5'-3' exonuclease